MPQYSRLFCILLIIAGCTPLDTRDPHVTVEILLENGIVYTGLEDQAAQSLDIGIAGERIVFVGDARGSRVEAARRIDATGKIVAPGFIDPHTHATSDLRSQDKNSNLNYLMQGVTTVFIGNDGDGGVDIAGLSAKLTANGIGTNTALFAGFGGVRQAVMGMAQRAPTAEELQEMKILVSNAMQAGAIGFSSGLYYAPQSYSETDEVIELAAEAAKYDGVYDTHIRDESSYNIGLLGAVKEALDIGRATGIAVNIGHIKALGVDVWGQSTREIAMIEEARAEGLQVTADQYPWPASGTRVSNALVPKWVMADSMDAYQKRLEDPDLLPQIKQEMRENLRIRGGADKLLITRAEDPTVINKTLQEVAEEWDMDVIDTAIILARNKKTPVASFNMHPDDIRNFMRQPWTMTSSDGTDGHPRKYASFPKKFRDYVLGENLMSISDFVHRSSALTAATFDLRDRGVIKEGNFADIIIFDPGKFVPVADFKSWDKLAEGMAWVIINGQLVISDGRYSGALAGRVLKKGL